VQSADGVTSYTRGNMVAFNPNTGAVLAFAPVFNGQVQAITQSGGSLYVSGDFSKGERRHHQLSGQDQPVVSRTLTW
jgi:hypothetical protein